MHLQRACFFLTEQADTVRGASARLSLHVSKRCGRETDRAIARNRIGFETETTDRAIARNRMGFETEAAASTYLNEGLKSLYFHGEGTTMTRAFGDRQWI